MTKNSDFGDLSLNFDYVERNGLDSIRKISIDASEELIGFYKEDLVRVRWVAWGVFLAGLGILGWGGCWGGRIVAGIDGMNGQVVGLFGMVGVGIGG